MACQVCEGRPQPSQECPGQRRGEGPFRRGVDHQEHRRSTGSCE